MSHAKRRPRKTPVIRQAMPPGSSPGALSLDPTAPHPRITVIGYGPDAWREVVLDGPGQIADYRDRWPVLWINVDGLGDHDVLREIGEQFALHRLALQDVVHVHQRAKMEPYDEHLFFVARMITDVGRVETEQLSLFLGDNYVLTFQERTGDSFGQVRQRIREEGRIRRAGPDYLAYALIDALIDAYYPVLEHYGDRIEALEEEALVGADSGDGVKIHSVKRELLVVRRALAPHREAVHALQRDPSAFVHETTHVYLRDCYDHVIQLLDVLETYRELSTGLLDVHLASVNNRMNEVMKVLTIFAAIFIPLSFIASVYGMNFSSESPWNMPELRWAFGYPAALLLMASVAGVLLLFFRRLGWIGSARPPARGGGRDPVGPDPDSFALASKAKSSLRGPPHWKRR